LFLAITTFNIVEQKTASNGSQREWEDRDGCLDVRC